MRGMITRRRMLRTSAATGVGLLAAGTGFRVLGQESQNLDLPQGSAGKLTVIHRTEYFEQAQTLFREIVTDFYLDLSFYQSYDSDPPDAAAEKTDYGVITSLGYSF